MSFRITRHLLNFLRILSRMNRIEREKKMGIDFCVTMFSSFCFFVSSFLHFLHISLVASHLSQLYGGLHSV